ncbi:uncharacterized protein LOC141588366 [Silene latifolia]|uniref:uncharacterized protein LOC141588366 n=1 Tax=Silene latifolia TaxID=37657 RepID=UPI003D7838B0
MDSLGFWNVRGMNNPNKQLDNKQFLYQNKFGLFGLVGTKIKEQDFLVVLNNLGVQWKDINNNMHHPGGRVWIIWVPQVFNVHLIADSDQHITVEVSDITSEDIFWYTIVYGSNSDSDRLNLWEQLTQIKDQCLKPWCICEDFNSVLDYNERLGREVTWSEIKDFRQCVDYCEVTDIVAHGSFFTWNNKQDPSTRVFSRIDRCLVNIEWLQLFPDSSAYFMNEGTFDHRPCICYRRKEAPVRSTSCKYFNMWSLDSKFKEVVANEWNKNISGVKMYQIVTKLRNLKKPLRDLNKNMFSDIERSAEVARVLLDSLHSAMHINPQDQQLLAAEHEAAEEFKTLNKVRTKYLYQKAKVEWLLEGDENTNFYHSRIKARQIHNKVSQIIDIEGVSHHDPLAIENAFLSYYIELLGSSKPTTNVHKPTVRTGNLINDHHV